MRTLITFILFAGMFLVISGIYEQKLDIAQKEKKIEYRFIPRSLYEEQLANNTTFADKLLTPLFEQNNVNNYDPNIDTDSSPLLS